MWVLTSIGGVPGRRGVGLDGYALSQGLRFRSVAGGFEIFSKNGTFFHFSGSSNFRASNTLVTYRRAALTAAESKPVRLAF